MKNGIFALIVLFACCAVSNGKTHKKPDIDSSAGLNAKVILDVPFAEESGVALRLDLFLPLGVKEPPLVVFIHGGGWTGGSRKNCPVKWLVQEGYALASIEYRLSSHAVFPAQIYDCKGAIRWLRAHAGEYGYDGGRIAAMGSSAGGHLVVLLGTSGGEQELEGAVGGNLDCSSRVQAVVDYFGPTDFVLRSKTQPQFTDDPQGTNYKLLGGPVGQNLKLAELAGGVNHVTKDDSPMLIIHGLMDKRVEVQQSICLYQKYKDAGLPVEIKFVENAGHGGSLFFEEQNRPVVNDFLERYLRNPQPGKSGQ
ncbi:MAG: alpha/beta hydrolase [Kiritimatiellales bacterium]|nr:alpha/beta hydrolase [Kiritimatiellales bacterium]MCF7863688.1 alpha/beta hydrolase [Kiritimatiellales bacterium]